MYTIKGKGLIWDEENNGILARFQDGVTTTEDKATADKLKCMGYEVSGTGRKKGKES